MNKDKILQISKRDGSDNYEVHFSDRVEYWSHNIREKLGEEPVEQAGCMP